MVELYCRQQKAGKSLDIVGLRPEYEKILDLFTPGEFDEALGQKPAKRHFIEEIGRAIFLIWKDIQTVITFVGELGVAHYEMVFQKRYRQEILLREISPEILARGWSCALSKILKEFEKDLYMAL